MLGASGLGVVVSRTDVYVARALANHQQVVLGLEVSQRPCLLFALQQVRLVPALLQVEDADWDRDWMCPHGGAVGHGEQVGTHRVGEQDQDIVEVCC